MSWKKTLLITAALAILIWAPILFFIARANRAEHDADEAKARTEVTELARQLRTRLPDEMPAAAVDARFFPGPELELLGAQGTGSAVAAPTVGNGMVMTVRYRGVRCYLVRYPMSSQAVEVEPCGTR
ncbi:hypothetical protein D5S17_25605 [Pseudonocardiaceae bacterium YIM PH 21723]|nr:hypothetical protein D5S17_25605 [Pseudonocardiaceae bacterium YIM PH 21723]